MSAILKFVPTLKFTIFNMAASAVLKSKFKLELAFFAILQYGYRCGILNLTLNLNWRFPPFCNMAASTLTLN